VSWGFSPAHQLKVRQSPCAADPLALIVKMAFNADLSVEAVDAVNGIGPAIVFERHGVSLLLI
jgi:hypothetical protein